MSFDGFRESGRQLLETKIYNSPDGDNCLYKVAHSAKAGAILGGFFSAMEIAGWSQPKTVPLIAGRFMHFTLPAVGAMTAFAGTSCLLGQIRQKDGAINHVFGGAAAGAVLGAKYQSIKFGAASGFLLAAAMGVYKLCVLEGRAFITEGPRNQHFAPIPIYGQKIMYEPYKKPDYE